MEASLAAIDDEGDMGSTDEGSISSPHKVAAPTLDRIGLAFAIAPATAGIGSALGLTLLGLFLASSGHVASWSRWLIGAAALGGLASAWAYPLALVVGVPSYVLLRRWVPLTPLRSTVVGAIIGGVVAISLLEVVGPQLRANMLLHGLIGWPHQLALGLASGALPGLTFWAVATHRSKAPRKEVR